MQAEVNWFEKKKIKHRLDLDIMKSAILGKKNQWTNNFKISKPKGTTHYRPHYKVHKKKNPSQNTADLVLDKHFYSQFKQLNWA